MLQLSKNCIIITYISYFKHSHMDAVFMSCTHRCEWGRKIYRELVRGKRD